MSETGRRLRALFEEIALPIDIGRVMAAPPARGGRRRGWVIALAAAVVVLVGGGGWLLFLRGGSQPAGTSVPVAVTTTAETTSTTGATSTTTTLLGMVQLQPIRVDCTSELDSFPCVALIDDDPESYWNAREGGVGAVLTYIFSPPVQILEVSFQNVGDEERFQRNARIKGIEVTVDDLPQATIAELADTNEPQRFRLHSLRTSRLTITITSAYPGWIFEGHEPFDELALAEVEFFGRVAPETPDPICVPAEVPLTVPDVVNHSEGEALLKLGEAGICPNQILIDLEPSADGPEGYVIATDPAAGVDLPVDGAITLIVSPAPAGDQLMMACGQVVVPYADSPPIPGPLSPEAGEALAVLEGMGEAAWFVDNYEWGLWEESESELVLLGEARPGAGLEEALFADAVFAKSSEGGWRSQGWGQCHWWAEMVGWGPAEWILDPAYPLDESTTTLHLLATERACASGEAPQGRQVTTVVWAADSSLTVIVLVEHLTGGALCPSNPQFPVTVDLGHPLGDLTLLDGATIPSPVRNPGP
jgi:hypothetical protein